ncbi:hypothetical protein D3C80_2020110 [compost metagenome]
MQQRLGRNAADVQAGAAVGRALFNNGNLQAELGRLDRANITTRSGADNNYIISHVLIPD